MEYFKPPKIMTFDKEKEITEDVVKEFIQKHQAELPRYQELMNMYKGYMQIYKQQAKAQYKPDVRLAVGFPKYIVDTFTGYFNGIPVKKSHPDKPIAEKVELFESTNDIEDTEHELAKLACVYGRAYELMYQDEETQTRVTYVSPENMFIVYDDTVAQERLFAVSYSVDDDGVLSGTVYTKESEYTFKTQDGTDKIGYIEETENIYDDLPVYEFYFNEERIGIFEGTRSLINNYNKALSEKANDVEYFSDSYLLMLGLPVEEKGMQAIRDNKTIVAAGEGSEKAVVKFLDKPDSDQMTENYLDRIERLIFKTSMVADISDENFGSSTSGTALAYKLQAMSNLALSFQRKFESALRTRYSLFFSVQTNFPESESDKWKELEFHFSRNQPKNLKEEAETALMLLNITSEETALSELSIVPDVRAEVGRKEAEKKEKMDNESFDITPVKEVVEEVK